MGSRAGYGSCIPKARKIVDGVVPNIKYLLGIKPAEGQQRIIMAIGHNGNQKHPRCAFFTTGSDWTPQSEMAPTKIILSELEETPPGTWFKEKAQQLAKKTFGPKIDILWYHEKRPPSIYFDRHWDTRERRGSGRFNMV